MALVYAAMAGEGALLFAAPSFDCAKAATPQEKAICADPNLARLDANLATAYAKARARLSDTGRREVQEDQRAWLAWLPKVCPEGGRFADSLEECLESEYLARPLLDVRRSGAFLYRMKVIAVPYRNDFPSDARFPQYGIGRFSWPEIDRPTASQQTWNDAIRTRVSDMSSPDDVAGSQLEVSAFLESANSSFIFVSVQGLEYGYGAAHPNGWMKHISWLANAGRELYSSDIFREGSGWERFLATLSLKEVGPFGQDSSSSEDFLNRIAAVVEQVSNWSLNASRLKVTCPPYSINPGSREEFQIDFKWNELRPYLAAGFDPKTLP